MFSKRIPFVAQMEAVECGAASLAMVLAYHGHHAPLSEVRQACGVSRDGSTAKNIVVAARGYGLVPRGRRLEPADLGQVTAPAILHWEMNHFVVLERWTSRRVHILDPAAGRRSVSAEQFDKSFTGICLEFSPGDSFETRPRVRMSRGRYLQLLRGAGRALAMVLVASLALNVLLLTVPVMTQIVLDDVVGRGRVGWLGLVAGSAAGLVTFSALYSLMREWLVVRTRQALDISITSSFVEHLLDLPVPFFAQRSAADLLMRVEASKTIRNALAGQSVSLLAGGVMMFAYLGLMFAFDPRLTGWVVAASVLYVIVYLVARPALHARADQAQRTQVEASSARLQVLRGIATIKSAGVERASHNRWLNALIEALNANARLALSEQFAGTVLFAIQALVPVIVLWVGGDRVLSGDLTIGRLVAFQMLQAGFLGPLDHIVQTLVNLQMVPVLLERMDDVLLSEREPVRDRTCPRLRGAITLDDVSFCYGPTAPEVLSGISMSIAPGQKVALVGPSGSGKSTLARLMLGLYAPSAGRILFDGEDLATLDLSSVRRQLGVVLQETALFDGTIADNLRLFYPNLPIDQVVQAARVAQIHDDIQALPSGYETRISGNGGTLSGGQRQRLALARAIVHHPPIMILDEATSALDAVTEAAIERYLATRDCTRVVIAHRLSTVRDADVIFVLDGGRIVEQGRHDDLVAAGGLYSRLAATSESAAQESEKPSERDEITAADLVRFAPFADWTDQERADLAEQLVRVEVPSGTRVVEQDARATGLFLLTEGQVTIELAEPGLAPWTVAELGPGSVVGEIGLLDGSPSSASVLSHTRVRMLHLPYARFQELAQRGDVLAVRAVLSLGQLVAERMADAVRRHGEVETGPASRQAVPVQRGTRTRRQALPLDQTLLGAALSAEEIQSLESIGRRRAVAAGDAIFVEGGAGDALYVLLAGRAERLHGGLSLGVVEPGALLGESAVFADSPRPTTARALEDCVCLVLPRDRLVELLTSGQRVARRLLSPLAEALVRQFRLANFRLREAVALRDGELERAHAAREQALAAAREERETLLAPADRHVPVVRVSGRDDAIPACVTAMLRALGRPVSLAGVMEAFASVGAPPEVAIAEVARSLGLSCRRLELEPGELRFIRTPLVAMLDGERAGVVERLAFGRFRVMDPQRGRATVPAGQLQQGFAGVAFELLEEPDTTTTLSLPARVWRFGQHHGRDLLRLLGVTLLMQGLVMGGALATAAAVGRVFPFGDARLLRVVVSAALALAIGAAVMRQLQARAIEHLRAHFDRELLEQMMAHVLKLPIAFFDRFAPGEILQRFEAFENVRLLFSTKGIAAVLSIATLLVGGVLLLVFQPLLAAIAAGVALIHAVGAWALVSPLKRSAGEEVVARGQAQDRLLEILQGTVTLRMSGDQSAAHQRWLPSFLREIKASVQQDRLRAFATPSLGWTRDLATVACVALGAHAVLEGTTSLAALVAFLGVLATFFGATSSLSSQVIASARTLVDYGLVRSTFLEPAEQGARGLVAPGQLRGRISLDQVSFRYTENGPLVLKDVSLDIESGTKVAIVGPSGSGKSTLGKLLVGFYLPTAGRVLFDGKDVASLDLQALRRRMGVVLQEPFLLTGTIRENIALGAENAPLERVMEAARKAAIHDDIQAMPMGYSTLVSEGGTAFSGGQRQRCVIARALVSLPAVILLDEATSALDNLSQAAIERHLAESAATRVVIAHRLSTVMDSDLIVVLDKGRIVEKGSHEQLMAAQGAYFRLVRAQLGGEVGSPVSGGPRAA